jgi:hypothetical protein
LCFEFVSDFVLRISNLALFGCGQAALGCCAVYSPFGAGAPSFGLGGGSTTSIFSAATSRTNC